MQTFQNDSYFQKQQVRKLIQIIKSFYIKKFKNIQKSIQIITKKLIKMFFDDKDLKSNFIQKKNKEKKKFQQNQQQNNNAVLIQKNIRSFLMRKRLINTLMNQGQFMKVILLKNGIDQDEVKQFQQITHCLLKQIEDTEKIMEETYKNSQFYLKKIFFASLKRQYSAHIAYTILQEEIKLQKKQLQLKQFMNNLITSHNFISELNKIIQKRKGIKLLNMTVKSLFQNSLLDKIDKNYLFELILLKFSENQLEEQSIHDQKIKRTTLLFIFDTFYNNKYAPEINFKDFQAISNILHSLLGYFNTMQSDIALEPTLSYLISLLLTSIDKQHQQLIKQISQQYNNILVLMEDEQDIQYFQNKIMNHQKMETFSSVVLKIMQEIFQSELIVKIFFDKKREESKLIKDVMIKSIKMLSRMFQDRRIIFLRSLLSSNQLLFQLEKNKSDQFYEGLKMRLLGMDDEQFQKFNLFTQNQWKDIIHMAISKSNKIIRSQLKNQNYNKQKLIPFQNKNEQNLTLSGLSQTIESLYKKSLRTKKIHSQIFISKQFTQQFYHFNFGTGALALEKLLKLYPFAFTFQSRLQKFKQLIKQDKLNHDRTLFLQQQVDDDLIVHVRRGKQFLDAYQSLMHKDLRRKYKLVFFNQQGLEQQGIDGGGLIKEFINRVLKSAFSEVYALFYQTDQHQLMPNPYSLSNQQYQFIGKIIGKAVYQSITIQQKFVQPFLNLVIGRKNSFQDLQYIDQQIYKSLLDIKKMKDQDLEDLQQTFVILDHLPNGIKKYVNLICPSKQVKGFEQENTFVTRQNKLQFIMAYSDFKCNKQLEQKTRYFRKGFLKVMKPEWLTLFNNQQLNKIISGGQPNFDVQQLRQNCVYVDYHQKSVSVVHFWQILQQFSADQKSQFLLYVTSCSRPPTLGFSSMKPKICISRDDNITHLPTANTCMNVFRLPDYKNKQAMRKKILYAIYSKAGFEFA